ncbi:hypothetical protein [Dactylosporangium sp. CA-139066]|uniref:hypothetical protein n=1 Tax=Dactylosporangium sp. CA-139066 TaxID=3239930 RepID=UPI003D8E829A
MAAARAGLAPDGGPAPVIRALSTWATVAMAAVAGTALVYLAITLLPLVDLWAARHPGPGRAALAGALRIAGWVLLAAVAALSAVAAGVWGARARSNLAAFGVRTRRLAHGSVGRSPGLRRRVTALVWSLWGALLAGGAATVHGVLAGLPNRAEIGAVREGVAAGGPVDRALAADLFGRQLVLGLPGAALFVLAAAAAVTLIAAVTSAQYGRLARLRAPDPGDGGTIGA